MNALGSMNRRLFYSGPLKVAAGNDAVALRKEYGQDVILGGTIDKRALIKGKKAIREEVMSKVPFLSGGKHLPGMCKGLFGYSPTTKKPGNLIDPAFPV
jgi:hypothetical protein